MYGVSLFQIQFIGHKYDYKFEVATSFIQEVIYRDVSKFEFEFECCWNPTVFFCKPEIRRIFRDIYVRFGFLTFVVESFVIIRHTLVGMQTAVANQAQAIDNKHVATGGLLTAW